MSVHPNHAEFESDSPRLVVNNFFDVDDDSIIKVRYGSEFGHGRVWTAGEHVASLIGELVESL